MENIKTAVLAAFPGLSGSREDWTALLDLSDEHQLPEARTIAIKKITAIFQLTPNFFDLIAMARKYGVKSWFRTGVQGFVQRPELLSEADAEKLGWRTVLKLFRLREKETRKQHPNAFSFHANKSTTSMEREFECELRSMDD